MSLLRRLLEFFKRKDATDAAQEWNESSLKSLLQWIKPEGNRSARRREWRGSWREYKS